MPDVPITGQGAQKCFMFVFASFPKEPTGIKPQKSITHVSLLRDPLPTKTKFKLQAFLRTNQVRRTSLLKVYFSGFSSSDLHQTEILFAPQV